MSETKVKKASTETNVEKKSNNSSGKLIFTIRDSRPKLDTSAINHGGTIVNSSDKKDTNKKQK